MGMSAGGGGKGVKSDINVTPLVDVVLVLLIIFMVITPMLQRGKDVNLPKTQKSEAAGKDGDEPLIVSITADRKIFFGTEKPYEVDEKRLQEETRKILQANQNKKILLKGDEALQFGDARKAMHMLRMAGAKAVGLGVQEQDKYKGPTMSGSRKKFAVNKAGNPNSEINVTPLVDVVLVLLIIFMVVTPLTERDIEVKIPQAEEVEDITEIPEGQVVVNIDTKGQILVNSEVIAEAEYFKRMQRFMAAKSAGEKHVFFMAEEKSPYGVLVKALDGAKRAGAEALGMMTELPEAAPK